jgi:hypothetical protein
MGSSLHWAAPICMATLAATVACQSVAQRESPDDTYLVTVDTIDVGDGIRLCIALEPTDGDGIWWWEPGRSGCSTRSTGPGLFRPEGAKVHASTQAGSVDAAFRLGTHSLSHPFIEVRLRVTDGAMQSMESGARVSVRSRRNLDVPEEF